jgi:putative (di)nucleoside polyphosphate hydrolase
MRRHDADQCGGARLHRPPRRRHRACRCVPRLADAAKRELYEETSVRSVEKLGEVADWLIYDIPRTVAGRTWKGRYRGQRQKWYAVRFTGADSEINVANPGGGHKAEFVNWRWEPMKNLPDLIVPFKRPVYERVVKEFSGLAGG